MRRITHSTWSALISVVYLGLMTNLLLVVASLPLVVLLVTTDPAHSWPLLAVAVPPAAPGVVAAFAVFRDHGRGGTAVARTFFSAWRSAWRRGFPLAMLATAVIVVVLVDVRAVSTSVFGVVVAPVLAVIALLTLSTLLVGLVAVSEAPRARMRDILRSAVYLSARRWYLTAVSLIVLGLQAALFTGMPAIALGLTAAPFFYVAWANSRFTLRPVLDDEPLDDEVATARSRP